MENLNVSEPVRHQHYTDQKQFRAYLQQISDEQDRKGVKVSLTHHEGLYVDATGCCNYNCYVLSLNGVEQLVLDDKERANALKEKFEQRKHSNS